MRTVIIQPLSVSAAVCVCMCARVSDNNSVFPSSKGYLLLGDQPSGHRVSLNISISRPGRKGTVPQLHGGSQSHQLSKEFTFILILYLSAYSYFFYTTWELRYYITFNKLFISKTQLSLRAGKIIFFMDFKSIKNVLKLLFESVLF